MAKTDVKFPSANDHIIIAIKKITIKKIKQCYFYFQFLL